MVRCVQSKWAANSTHAKGLVGLELQFSFENVLGRSKNGVYWYTPNGPNGYFNEDYDKLPLKKQKKGGLGYD